MKNMKKKVVAIALVAALIAILSLGSLAYFSAKDDITNTIKLADKFDVDVYETDKDGKKIMEGDETVGQTYEDIMPGQTLKKDPTVLNTGTHPEYIRVHVTLSSYSIWADALSADENKVDLATIFTGFDSNAWTRYDAPVVDEEADTVTYTFYLTKYRSGNVLPAGDAAALFTGIKIPGALTVEQAEAMENEFTINVIAEAIQSEFLPESVTTAQEAFALLEE